MAKKPVVLSALAAALSFNAATASTSADGSDPKLAPQEAQLPSISAETREALLQSASKIAEQSKQPFQVAQGKFKLFDNGPSFVETKPKSK